MHLLKLPDSINPMNMEEAQPKSENDPPPGTPLPEPTVSNFIKSEIDKTEHQDLQFTDLLQYSVEK